MKTRPRKSNARSLEISESQLRYAVAYDDGVSARIIARFEDYREASRFQARMELLRQNASTDDDGYYFGITR